MVVFEIDAQPDVILLFAPYFADAEAIYFWALSLLYFVIKLLAFDHEQCILTIKGKTMNITNKTMIAFVFGLITTISSTSRLYADADIEKGKVIYNGSGACSSCHGPLGAGDGPAAAALPAKPANFILGNYKYDTDGDGKKGTETDVFNIITNGAQKYGGNMMMVARADLPETDRKALAKYVVSLKK